MNLIRRLAKMESQEYVKDQVFRYVVNYDYCFNSNCKGRWLKKPILEVFENEFKAFKKEYYKKAIEEGKITVNEEKVDEDYILQNGDRIKHFTIRRELPVYNVPFTKLYEDDELYAINKPPSIPVHPCGAYNKNSVIHILRNEYGLKELSTFHRLDKLTSGVLVLAKGKQLTNKYADLIKDRFCEKTYLARVEGKIEEDEFEVLAPIYCESIRECMYRCPKNDEQLKISKESQTKFKLRWYDERSHTSLLECYPKTGRTHQIRVHLNHIGHPIINDENYGGRVVGNLFAVKLKASHPETTDLDDLESNALGKRSPLAELKEDDCKDIASLDMLDNTVHNTLKNYTMNSEDKIMEIMLHALRYKIDGRIIEAPEPYWVEVDIVPDCTKVKIIDN